MSQHIHILGICGTFMGGLALLARELGYTVSGSDANIYPPMSTQLKQAGIALKEGYLPEHLDPLPDLIVIGNAISRGNPVVEMVLNCGLPYISGPQWLGEHLLPGKWVLAVAGTHGKTTTTSMLAWILEYAGMSPGFLVGGVPINFGVSARAGDPDFFVVEADEYDTAFFDKRSKFVHYHPRTLIIGNLEFDHADIFSDLSAIETQFHHLIRCVPGSGVIIRPPSDAIDRVLARGVWTRVDTFSVSDSSMESDVKTSSASFDGRAMGSDGNKEGIGGWHIASLSPAGERFELSDPLGDVATVEWSLIGKHNLANACAAAAAASHAGVSLPIIAEALSRFRGVKRRLEFCGSFNGVQVYDDFAHHPTAIATTLEAMTRREGVGRVFAVIELRSNTMRSGVHRDQLAIATREADHVFWYQPPGLDWSLEDIVADSQMPAEVIFELDLLVMAVADMAEAGDAVVVMSNGSFGGFHQKLIDALAMRE